MAVKMILTVVAVVLQVIISCSQAQDYNSQHARTSGGNTGQYQGSVSGEDTGPYMDELMNTTWSNGDLRLVGVGSTGVSGRLEIFIETGDTSAGEEGEWGTVCGDTFTMREANVACRQLGYHGASNWTFATNALFGEANGSMPILLSGVKCSSAHQLHTLRCKHNEIGSTSDCNHAHDVVLYCDSNFMWQEPYNGQVRLVADTLAPSSGRVEVHQGKKWGTVCARDFGQAAADSVCRQLGYTGSAAISVASSSGSGIVWVSSTICNKSRACFTSCFKAHTPTYKCNHTEDVAVQCTFDVSSAEVNSAGSRSKCKIRGFPVALLIVGIVLSLLSLLLLGSAITVVFTFTQCCRKKWAARRYEQLS